MGLKVGLGLLLALVSTALTNIAYLREHDAAAALPVLSLRYPLHSAKLLLQDRPWLGGFAIETIGFLLFAAALALASLAVVQSIQAGGIGVLAFVSARIAHRRLDRLTLVGVLVSFLGLLLLAVSLAGGSGNGGRGSTNAILVWLSVSATVALIALTLGRSSEAPAVADGVAGGLFFSIGDISTKLVTQGDGRVGFLLTLILGYAIGTGLLQVGYQAGQALTVAGLATLLTNAVPIAAGTILLHEHVPNGALGVLRVLAFAAVTLGAVLLGRPQSREEDAEAGAITSDPGSRS